VSHTRPDLLTEQVEAARRTRPWWRRAGIVTLVVLLSLVLAAGGVLAGLLWYGERSVRRIEVQGIADPVMPGPQPQPSAGEPQIAEITEVVNVLLVGTDSRAGLSDEDLRRLGTRAESGDRTDTVMLLQLDPNDDRAAVLSFPRDLLVTRCDGSRGKLNGAYELGLHNGDGGPDCLVQTVAETTGIPIHHFVAVDFAGFIKVVDALGGVSLYLDEPLKDRYAGLNLPAGCVTLDGAQALGFVRARHLDSDFGRIARQQRFMREMVHEATSVGTLVNVPRLFTLVNTLGATVETDSGLTLGDMRRIAFSLRNLTAANLQTYAVPVVDDMRDGVYYARPVERDAEPVYHAFRTGTAASGPAEQRPAELAVTDVAPVQVLNANSRSGLAAAAAQALIARGFQVAGTGNAQAGRGSSEVRYPPGGLAQARLVAESFPGALLVAGDESEGLTVLVGADYDPAATPPVTTPSPAPTPAPTPTPTPTYAGATVRQEVAC
jgi:LCP family protein required for cell wall assembly